MENPLIDQWDRFKIVTDYSCYLKVNLEKANIEERQYLQIWMKIDQ